MKRVLLISVLVLTNFIACTRHRVKPNEPVHEVAPPPYLSEQNSTKKEEPLIPPGISAIPVEPPKPPSGDAVHVGLVLGGAGVASFATVGILKRFHEEGIVVDYIVTTGWPTLFSLAYSYMKSVHDMEWFAMRLNEKDFYKAGIFSPETGYASHEKLSSLVETAFQQRGLEDGKVPVVVSATNTEPGDPEISDKGDWRIPLLKTMSVPGIYRPYPSGNTTEWITSLQGIDVEEGMKRGAKTVVAVEMYDDYFHFLKTGKKDSSDQVFRKLYLNQLRKTIAKELSLATLTGRIALGGSPTDFSQKRAAVFAGYKEGARLARQIRK